MLRRHHKKTKTGCACCKRRRIKCDETKPVCLRCQKRGYKCEYLPVVTHRRRKKGSVSASAAISKSSSTTPVAPATPAKASHEPEDQRAGLASSLFAPSPRPSAAFNCLPRGHQVNGSGRGSAVTGSSSSSSSMSQASGYPITAPNSSDTPNSFSPFFLDGQPPQSAPQDDPSVFGRPLSLTTFGPTKVPEGVDLAQQSLLRQLDYSELGNYSSPHSCNAAPYMTQGFDSSARSSSVSSSVATNIKGSYGMTNDHACTLDDGSAGDGQKPRTVRCNQEPPCINEATAEAEKISSTVNPNSEASTPLHPSFLEDIRVNIEGFIPPVESDNVSHSESGKDRASNPPVHPMFISNRTDLSYVSDLRVPHSIKNYTFYADVLLKLNFHAMNTMPFRIVKDAANRQFIVECIKHCALYDFLYHAFIANAALDLYYQQVVSGSDDVLNLDKEAYLTLGDYHISRSMCLLVDEVNVHEETKKAIALVLTSMLHIYYSMACPTQRVATRAFYGLGKNLGVLFTRYAVSFRCCMLFNLACARYIINDYSKDPAVYFPEFLTGLSSAHYDSDLSGRIKVLPLSKDDADIIDSVVERLRKEFRAYMNKSNVPNPVGSSRFVTLESLVQEDGNGPNDYRPVAAFTHALDSHFSTNAGSGVGNDSFFSLPAERPEMKPSRTLEFDIFGSLSRFIVDIPDRFIELIDQGDPRALIVVGYNVMALFSRSHPYWQNSTFGEEIAYIDKLIDKCENSQYWKAWLQPARESMVD